MIYKYIVVLKSPMILSSIEIDSWVPEKKIFEGSLPYMGIVAILVICDLDYLNIHWFPLPIDASYKILL